MPTTALKFASEIAEACSQEWEGLFCTQATHAVLLPKHCPWFVDCASIDEVCCPWGGCSGRQGKDSMHISKSDGWKYGIKSETVIFYLRKIGSGRGIESQEFNILQGMEAWSEHVKSRSSPEWICIVGMAMSKTNASEPWAAGKAFTYRSSVEWQSFLPVQVWAFVSDWLVCTKTSSWNFIHQDAHTALDCWPVKNSYRPAHPSPCTIHSQSAEVLGCCAVGACTAHLAPALLYAHLCVCPFFHSL